MAITYDASRSYDHAQYLIRIFPGGTVQSGTLTARNLYVAAEAAQAYQAYGIITTAGSTTTSAFDAVLVTGQGATTATVASVVVSSATAGSTFAIDLSTSGVAPTSIPQGAYMYLQTRLDATLTGWAHWEIAFPPTSGMVTPSS